MEISSSSFAITKRRIITCHHCVYDEVKNETIVNVAICSRIVKVGEMIQPDPMCRVYLATCYSCHQEYDYAVFEIQRDEPDLQPIPICPESQLPKPGSHILTCYYGAIGDFLVGEMSDLAIWRGGPYSLLQYGRIHVAGEQVNCKVISEQGLCRGSSGGAIVMNGYVVAMHISSLRQGRSVWKYLRGSSLHHHSDIGDAVTDISEIYSAYKEGLVLCRVQGVLNAINDT